jgi:hypothetical protein
LISKAIQYFSFFQKMYGLFARKNRGKTGSSGKGGAGGGGIRRRAKWAWWAEGGHENFFENRHLIPRPA